MDLQKQIEEARQLTELKNGEPEVFQTLIALRSQSAEKSTTKKATSRKKSVNDGVTDAQVAKTDDDKLSFSAPNRRTRTMPCAWIEEAAAVIEAKGDEAFDTINSDGARFLHVSVERNGRPHSPIIGENLVKAAQSANLL